MAAIISSEFKGTVCNKESNDLHAKPPSAVSFNQLTEQSLPSSPPGLAGFTNSALCVGHGRHYQYLDTD